MSQQLLEHNGLFINGEWRSASGDETIQSINPANPSEIVSEFPSASRAEASVAVDVAVAAQNGWTAKTSHERGVYLRDAAAYLNENKERLSELIVREVGKCLGSARGEMQRTIDILQYYAEVARDNGGIITPSANQNTTTYTVREPLGTVSVITPWNYPMAIPAWKIGPALATGNTAVFKPASPTVSVGAELVRAFEEAGLPDGVLNFITGSGSTVGDEFVTNESIDMVSFTGSSNVGQRIYQSATDDGKRIQGEMGGKNPIIVDESADLDVAVDLTLGGGVRGLSGQACTATSRAIIFESVYDEYVEKLVDAIDDIEIGDPLEKSTAMGPKSTESELAGTLEYIDIGKQEGATLLTGGERIDREGYFVEPAVFVDVEPDMRIAQEEIFGPVISVIEVSNYEEAIEVANGVEYGLSASICTNRLDHAQDFIGDIESGIVKINQTSSGIELQMPFGGKKKSSTGTFKEQGRQAFDFYTHEKAIYVSHYDAN